MIICFALCQYIYILYKDTSCINRKPYFETSSVSLSPVPRMLAGQTVNIDINKSIVRDIPRRHRGENARLQRRKQSRSDAKVPGIFHDSSLASSSISLLLSFGYTPRSRCCSTRVYCTEITPAGDLTTLIEGSLCVIQARTNELAQSSAMFGSMVRPARILPRPDKIDLHRTSTVIHLQR